MTLVRPTRNAAGLALLVVALWYAGASQSNGAAYLLCFIIVGVALVSSLHTRMNLRGLAINAESPAPVVAGQEAALPIEVANHSRASRYSLALMLDGAPPVFIDAVPPSQAARAELRFIAPGRGEHIIESIRIGSSYPLGFFAARRRVVIRRSYLVYPRPVGAMARPVAESAASVSLRQRKRPPGDDFTGVRPYLAGESQRHIDWKAAARGQPLLIKQFGGDIGDTLWIDWKDAPQPDLEARLSQLALWIIEAGRTGAAYGLRLPGSEIAPAQGEAHHHRCMRALALFKA